MSLDLGSSYRDDNPMSNIELLNTKVPLGLVQEGTC
jgi:hypothetical protein